MGTFYLFARSLLLYVLLLYNKISQMKIPQIENYIFCLMCSKLYINCAIFKGDAISSVTMSCNLETVSIKVPILYRWTTVPSVSKTCACSAVTYQLRFLKYFCLSSSWLTVITTVTKEWILLLKAAFDCAFYTRKGKPNIWKFYHSVSSI